MRERWKSMNTEVFCNVSLFVISQGSICLTFLLPGMPLGIMAVLGSMATSHSSTTEPNKLTFCNSACYSDPTNHKLSGCLVSLFGFKCNEIIRACRDANHSK